MGAVPSHGAGRAAGHSRVGGEACTFPSCDRDPVTEAGMCDVHRLVVISSTGSWLEAS
ncbi:MULTISPECIES: hypothetical protein [Nocardioides]|uniref:Uncharacterized protein n=1 Tax=Nocardioides vastitatis TaxID=2568655 RepID=A0ABW0ZMV0_9ACTN|nr:hypothetical protein [Nocardioides sp.]